LPSTKIIKRSSLSVKYDFDIWGRSTGNVKSSGLSRRLYLKPRFIHDIRKATTRGRNCFKQRWKRRIKGFHIASRGPYPKYRHHERFYSRRLLAIGPEYPLFAYLRKQYNKKLPTYIEHIGTLLSLNRRSASKIKKRLKRVFKHISNPRLRFITRSKYPKRIRKKRKLRRDFGKLKVQFGFTSKKHFGWWKSATKQILRFRDPYPAFDRPKDQTQVYRRRSFSNDLICKMIRMRMYFGYSKEYQFRTFLAKARNRRYPNLPNATAFILECRLPYMLLRAGFVKNYEFAQYLVKLGCVTVKEIPITDIHYIVPRNSWVRLKFPPHLEHLRQGKYVKNRIFTYQRIALSSHFEINWKLLKVRLVRGTHRKQPCFLYLQQMLQPFQVIILRLATRLGVSNINHR